jgi:DNA replication protein DnaT
VVNNNSYAAMNFEWQPDADSFLQLAQIIGLIDKTINEADVGEFVAYWCGRPETMKTPYQWHLAFTQNMKRKRTAYGTSRKVEMVGSQLVPKVAKIEIDDNARQLQQKYGPNTVKNS